jgi:hypothetical protein
VTTAAPPGPLLLADTPAAWVATHLAAFQAAHDDEPGPVAGHRWTSAGELLADGAAPLRREHARLTADGTTPAAAAKWLVGWYAGGIAEAVGFAYATGAAALLPDPAGLRFRVHPDGWPDRADPAAREVAVAAGHAWAGQPGVRVVADDAALAALVVGALTAAVDPIVRACRTLAKVGTTALWTEVGDGFGLPVLHRPALPVAEEVVRRLQEAVRTPRRPWRQVPDLRAARVPAGWAYLGRKAGCCLSYQCPDEPAPDPAEVDERTRAHDERFPPDGPRYCSTCSLRDLAGCEQRQEFWLEQERACRPSVDVVSLT